MAKSRSIPKHHNFNFPPLMRAYLNQLEAALLSAATERDRAEKRILELERRLYQLERRVGQ